MEQALYRYYQCLLEDALDGDIANPSITGFFANLCEGGVPEQVLTFASEEEESGFWPEERIVGEVEASLPKEFREALQRVRASFSRVRRRNALV